MGCSLDPLISPLPQDIIVSEIRRLAPWQTLIEQGPFQVLLAKPWQIPFLLLEVGRLRELTFRSAGEGTGASFDLDAFDEHYDQLILWNRERQEVAGAYRMAVVDEALRKYGPQGVYTASLFRLKPAFFGELGPAVELGRSFVRLEYQRRPLSLFLLWRGIGCYLESHPHCGTLFGPVSISAQYSVAARSAMAEYFDRHSGEPLKQYVHPRRRFPAQRQGIPGERAMNLEMLDRLVRSTGAETDVRGLPVLLRHYLSLGGRVLSISVDPAFGSCLDALVVLDLRLSDARILGRVLGSSGTAAQARLQRQTSVDAVQV